jgi:hypothetical protein
VDGGVEPYNGKGRLVAKANHEWTRMYTNKNTDEPQMGTNKISRAGTVGMSSRHAAVGTKSLIAAKERKEVENQMQGR